MKILRLLIVAGILIFACGTALADDLNLYFSPANSNQAVGSSFTINILADIQQTPGLVDYGFDLVWDDSLMQLTNVGGTGSPFDVFWDSVTEITGLLSPTPTSPPSEYGTGILLATLDFKCLQLGTSPLNISVDDPTLLVQGFYGPSTDPTAGPGPLLSFTVTPGSVTQGVPEPNSILLLSSGLIGLAIWTKRKVTA